MNVRTLCLAILNARESTGYEIRKLSTEGHFSHFVDASFGSIYPALSKLEEEGLVTSREEIQSGKPPRKVYSITDAGRYTFLGALSEPVKRDIFKSEFMLIAMCAEFVEPAALSKAFDDQIAYIKGELDIIDAAVEETDLEGVDWVANYGRTCLTQSLAYIEKNRARLEAVAGTSLQDGGDALAVAAE